MFFAVYNGIKEVDQRLVERIRTLGGGTQFLIREVYVPSVTAWVMGNLKVAVGFAFTGAVVGEFVASSRGLGYLLQFAQSTYNAGLTMALIVVIMVVRARAVCARRAPGAPVAALAVEAGHRNEPQPNDGEASCRPHSAPRFRNE